MAKLDEAKVAEIVGRVMERILPQLQGGLPSAPAKSEPYCAPAPPHYTPGTPAVHTTGRLPGVFDDMDRAGGDVGDSEFESERSGGEVAQPPATRTRAEIEAAHRLHERAGLISLLVVQPNLAKPVGVGRVHRPGGPLAHS